MPQEYTHKDFDPANKYELYVNGNLVYFWYKLKVNAEEEFKMIESVKKKFAQKLANAHYHTIYKTTKERIE